MKIKSIKLVPPKMVYALRTSSGTFIADGLAHHNCAGCNTFRHGNLSAYALYLQDKYGPKILEELDEIRKQQVKYSKSDYLELIEKYSHAHP